MTVSVFLTWPDGDPEPLHAAFLSGPLAALAESPDLRFIETYRPAAGEVTAFTDGAGPPLLVELNLDGIEAARGLVRGAALRDALSLGGTTGETAGKAAVDVFETAHFPIPGHAEPPPRTAPLSFVVRYYRPVADAEAFARFYTEHHPPLLARFPDVRNVLCYLPVACERPAGIRSTGAFLGNEVVFDDIGALNRALASDVLPLLIADGKRFAPFGYNRHHAMQRQTAWARSL